LASIVERVGAFVGFGALLGLGILSLLYFSQARDVRRLREWAGRAPDRAAEAEARFQTVQPTVTRQPVAAQTAAGKAAQAAGETAQAGAVTTDADAEQAAPVEGESEELEELVDQPTVAHTPVDEPADARVPVEETMPRQHYMPGTAFGDRPQRRRKPLHQRIRNMHIPQLRYLLAMLAIVAFLVLGLGTLAGVIDIGGGSDESNRGQRAAQADKRNQGNAPANVDPSQVTVAVLNGTTVTGLAFRISQEAKTSGFTLGNVTNAATTDQSSTEVLYAPGQKNAARAVGDRLGISAIAPVDSVNSEIAGSADAVVLVGADRSSE
jgi:hypothetical protein